MKKKLLIKFYFDNNLHVGNDLPGIKSDSSMNFIHSDTLFSALCNVWSMIDWNVKNKLEEFLNSFSENYTPLLLSSCFPFIGDDKYFFPKPLIEPSTLYKNQNQKYKLKGKIKDIDFIDTRYLKKWLLDNDNPGWASNDDLIWDLRTINSITPHNSIDRINAISNYFSSDNLFFANEVGLYSLVIIEEKYIDILNSLLINLKTIGLGGNRTTGSGSIKNYFISDNIPQEIEDLFSINILNKYYTLSLYYPIDNLITDSAIAYELTLRKGWIGSSSVNISMKRKTCYMFSEGSIFNKIDKGKLVDVTPEEYKKYHNVYRNGCVMTFPLIED